VARPRSGAGGVLDADAREPMIEACGEVAWRLRAGGLCGYRRPIAGCPAGRPAGCLHPFGCAPAWPAGGHGAVRVQQRAGPITFPCPPQTWMDEDGIPEVLKTERMGHEMPGMHGVYGHVSPAMRADLKAALQERWESSLRERARLSPRSIVPALDALLAAYRQAPGMIRSQLAPKIGYRGNSRRQLRSRLGS
jgi:hypothetical protein